MSFSSASSTVSDKVLSPSAASTSTSALAATTTAPTETIAATTNTVATIPPCSSAANDPKPTATQPGEEDLAVKPAGTDTNETAVGIGADSKKEKDAQLYVGVEMLAIPSDEKKKGSSSSSSSSSNDKGIPKEKLVAGNSVTHVPAITDHEKEKEKSTIPEDELVGGDSVTYWSQNSSTLASRHQQQDGHTCANSSSGGSGGNASSQPTCSSNPPESLPGAFFVRPTMLASTANSEAHNSDVDNDDWEHTLDPAPEHENEHDEPVNTSEPLTASLVGERRRRQRKRQVQPPVNPAINHAVHVIEGEAVNDAKLLHAKCAVKVGLGFIAVFLVVIVLMALAISGEFESKKVIIAEDENKNTSSPVVPSLSRLQEIKDRGFLRCSFHNIPGLHYMKEDGTVGGLYTAACKAVAAAIFGDASLVEYVPGISYAGQFQQMIRKGEIDMLSMPIPPSMEREVVVGYEFTVPYLFRAAYLAGDPNFVRECVDNGMKHWDECANISVCVPGRDDTTLKFLGSIIAARRVVIVLNSADRAPALINGTCNIMETSPFDLVKLKIETGKLGYEGDIVLSDKPLMEVPLSIGLKNGDPEFSDFVSSIISALIVAEQQNITQQTAEKFPETSLFGEEHRFMFQNAIKAEGNLDEIYDKYFPTTLSRRTASYINNASSPLMMSRPFGFVSREPDDAPISETLQAILDRGVLRCGVTVDRPGFAATSNTGNGTLSGMDVDYCIALASSIFDGQEDMIALVELSEVQDGFTLLANNEVDVLTGAFWNLANDVREPTTGIGYSFSKPYFYGYSQEQDNLALATRQEDHFWSTFVHWIVECIIYAEENNVTQVGYFAMPEVQLYGPKFTWMFRWPILRVGNYGNIYERNVEPFIHREGRNMLNMFPSLGPQHYPLPGMV